MADISIKRAVSTIELRNQGCEHARANYSGSEIILIRCLAEKLFFGTADTSSEQIYSGVIQFTKFVRSMETIDILSAKTKQSFLGMAVNAFLNHDFAESKVFYFCFVLVDLISNRMKGDLDAFYNLSLNDKHPQAKHIKRNTLTTVRAVEEELVDREVILRLVEASQLLSEFHLLKVLKQNTICTCLDLEDPRSELYSEERARKKTSLCKDLELHFEEKASPYSRKCYVCNSKDAELQVCGGCCLVRYCSKTCQKEDWTEGEHKNVCKKHPWWWGRAPMLTILDPRIKHFQNHAPIVVLPGQVLVRKERAQSYT
jgi:hypothetical protein